MKSCPPCTRQPSRSCCAFSPRSRPRTRIGSAPSPTPTASSSTCRRRAPRPPCRSTRRHLGSRTSCRNSGSSFPTRRPSSRRSIRRSIACWYGAPSPCWIPGRANASSISFAASATSRCRSPAAAPPSSASKGARRWSAGRRRTPRRTGSTGRATFRVANLFAATAESVEALGSFDKALIDPPREGAIAVAKALPPDGGPRRIVYVSCNPATLARDAAVLVQDRGYTLAAAGVINMFPHTAHVESMALFER